MNRYTNYKYILIAYTILILFSAMQVSAYSDINIPVSDSVLDVCNSPSCVSSTTYDFLLEKLQTFSDFTVNTISESVIGTSQITLTVLNNLGYNIRVVAENNTTHLLDKSFTDLGNFGYHNMASVGNALDGVSSSIGDFWLR